MKTTCLRPFLLALLLISTMRAAAANELCYLPTTLTKTILADGTALKEVAKPDATAGEGANVPGALTLAVRSGDWETMRRELAAGAEGDDLAGEFPRPAEGAGGVSHRPPPRPRPRSSPRPRRP